MAGGPDVWEIVVALRHTGERGEAQVPAAAEQLGVPKRLVRTAVDFVALLEGARSEGEVTPPVVLALKRTLPTAARAMAHELASRPSRWADEHPDPHRHLHWLRA